MRHLLGVVLMCVCATLATAETYVVNPEGTGDYPTIQAAIDAAIEGDVIALTDGIYTGDGNWDIIWPEKEITIESQSGDPQACLLDCQGGPGGSHFGMLIEGLGFAGRLAGITIANAVGLGAMFLLADITIEGCIFRDNAGDSGGAIDAYGEIEPVLINCTFQGNHGAQAGAICICAVGSALVQCTFYDNSGAASAIDATETPMTIENSILAFGDGPVITGYGPSLTCCDIYGNIGGDWIEPIASQLGVNGNICEDPLFCDAPSGDLTLDANSPCLPGPECDLMGAWPEGCGATPVNEVTWGEIKRLFNRR